MRMVITLGREFGSGGRELGRRLADHLQIAYYDKEILSEIAKRTQLTEEYIHNVVEHHPYPLLPITVGHSLYPDMTFQIQQSVYVEQSNIIKEMAAASDCVIVGRCADYILRDINPFRIFVYADMESRIARCHKRAPEGEHLSDKEMKQMIQKVDKGRSKYYEFYTGEKWGNKSNYDLCINTSNVVIKELVPHLAAFLS
ncbi:MAG: cytidylate kinase-like family protein [Spirochaetes bacterium]|uniref:Cytidylate kinase-like family protein n=1 Tax=Candidatus Ornithospirochaeta stercoripullorum TaxID=2840899 RepID=A0A9D9H3T6_9SPIO|nr:cytidylate kinase-like family protein [Candidatus Ornithospirochaeta stercoripullorum]